MVEDDFILDSIKEITMHILAVRGSVRGSSTFDQNKIVRYGTFIFREKWLKSDFK